MRNKWCFEKAKLFEIEVVERNRKKWQEFRVMRKEDEAPRQGLVRQGRKRRVPQQEEKTVGCHTICTSSIFQQWPLKSVFGLLATDFHGIQQKAEAMTRNRGTSAISLALEAVRSAKLLAYQRGWRKVVIRSDVQEIVTMLQ